MLLALAFTFAAANVPHTELPSAFREGRVFAMPRLENSQRRLMLWLDTDGSGFVRGSLVTQLRLQTGAMRTAFLPALERGFPPVTGNRGALPVLSDADVAKDPIFAGLDGQLGWSWFADRIWTIDYVGHRFYLDYAAPEYPSNDRVPLTFDRMHRYPSLDIAIDGKTYHAALDTAATVALADRTMAASFIPRRTLDAWHAAHPGWQYVADAGASSGVSLIRVPEVRAGRVTFRNVWFSTRPGDDVFQGETVDAKLGPTAFGNCAVTIDYVHDAAGFECSLR